MNKTDELIDDMRPQHCEMCSRRNNELVAYCGGYFCFDCYPPNSNDDFDLCP